MAIQMTRAQYEAQYGTKPEDSPVSQQQVEPRKQSFTQRALVSWIHSLVEVR